MIISELYSLIVLGEQTRNVELKQSLSWDDPTTKAKVVKAVLGLSNLRNGGFLIIGVEENDGVFTPVGITEEHLTTYNYDNVMGEISRFADPKAIVRMEIVEDTEQPKKFLNLPHVFGFVTSPCPTNL